MNAARASSQLAVRTHSPTIALDATEGDAGDGDAAAVCAGRLAEAPAEGGALVVPVVGAPLQPARMRVIAIDATSRIAALPCPMDARL